MSCDVWTAKKMESIMLIYEHESLNHDKILSMKI